MKLFARLKENKLNQFLIGLFGLLIVFFGVYLFGRSMKSPADFFKPGSYLYTDCEIRDHTGKVIRDFGIYDNCVFFDDGTFIGAKERKGIFYIGKNGETIWSLPIFPHHQMNALEDKQSVIVTSSDVVLVKGKKTKFDSLFIISKTGKVLHEWHLRDYWSQIKQKLQINEVNFANLEPHLRERGAVQEASHLNSVHEIPDTGNSPTALRYKKGNFIVNILGPIKVILILSADLKKILSISRTNSIKHDLQILPSGKMLAYVNFDNSGAGKLSRLELSDPITDKIEWTYQRPTFFSEMWGSVQSLENGKFWLFTEHDRPFQPKIKIVDKEGNLLWQLSLNSNGSRSGGRVLVFRALILDLSRFLSLNSSGK